MASRTQVSVAIFLSMAICLLATPAGFAQEADKKTQDKKRAATQKKRRKNFPPRMKPTQADVAYGDHQRNRVDFYAVKSDKPTPLFVWIHGGGFRAGDKRSIPGGLLRAFHKAGVSCASINYRLSQHAPYPAQMKDSARAIQFLRSKAKEWNIDPSRIAAGGGSAGSGISRWLAFHEDLAKPDAKGIARYSTRLSCALALNMQSTYDPRVIKKLIPGRAYTHPALPPFFGLPQKFNWDKDKIEDKTDALIKDASPINHLTDDDAPVYVLHYQRSNKPGNIHHSNFGNHLKQAMDARKIECLKKMDTDYTSMNEAYSDMVKFTTKQFARQGTKK